MRIDLPCCGFKNCRYYFDGNCTEPSEQGKCEYWYLLHKDLYGTQPHWIPCSERLPEKYTDVLTCNAYGDIWICLLIFTGRNNEVCWEDNYGYLHKFDEQIAWMPLPPSYKSKGEKE